MIERIKKIRSFMEGNRLDLFLVTKPENIRYLCGFSAGNDARLVITLNEQFILTDSRYIEQAQRECPDWNLKQEHLGRLDSLTSICDKYNRLAVESHSLSYERFQQYASVLKNELVPLANTIEKFRTLKDMQELDLLRTSARIGDSVFAQICLEIQEGVSEKHIANRITFLLKEGGSSKESFDTIAVAGANASLPHGQPGTRLLKSGDMLTMDFGGYYQGYAGDMTRTVMIGEPTPKLRDIYQQVLEAQELGVSLVKAGISCREIDRQVRENLKKYGLDIYFQHSTGHGVGLEVHESPRLSPLSDDVLEEGMVFTIEPGVYIPGWGGIRIEDTIIVKKRGCEIITRSDKGLLIL
ncbi:MAG: Xaa-Pro peptidase family protein [Syntrophomonas sp.]|nr:Xaa-Pro peptidase family protein [Syntrophomonas sp.]